MRLRRPDYPYAECIVDKHPNANTDFDDQVVINGESFRLAKAFEMMTNTYDKKENAKNFAQHALVGAPVLVLVTALFDKVSAGLMAAACWLVAALIAYGVYKRRQKRVGDLRRAVRPVLVNHLMYLYGGSITKTGWEHLGTGCTSGISVMFPEAVRHIDFHWSTGELLLLDGDLPRRTDKVYKGSLTH